MSSQLSSLSDHPNLSMHKQLEQLPLSMLTVAECLIYLRCQCSVILLTLKYVGKCRFHQTEDLLFTCEPVDFPTVYPVHMAIVC